MFRYKSNAIYSTVVVSNCQEYHDDGLQGQPDEHSNIKCVENSSSLEPAGLEFGLNV